MKRETALKYTRQNTGTHMLDSGGIYGRHWQSPAPQDGLLKATTDGFEISLTDWLAELATIHPMHASFYRYAGAEGRGNLSWFELEQDYMESRGYVEAARDNVYNSDNDFDQVFVWAVWVPEHAHGEDWIYCDEAVISIFCHTGCDVRGGYSSPIFCTFDDCEYALPLDWQVSMCCEDFTDDENERLMVGYSSYPFGELEQILDDKGFELDGINPDKNCMIAVNNDTGLTLEIYGEYFE